MVAHPEPAKPKTPRRSAVAPAIRRLAGLRGRWTALGMTLATLLGESTALAQLTDSDMAPPLPNVLLLVDTSGSMELMVDGTKAVCDPSKGTTPNRWGVLTQALGGNVLRTTSASGAVVPEYRCESVERKNTNAAFVSEYSVTLGGKSYLPVDAYSGAGDFHHAISWDDSANNGAGDGCLYTPGVLPTTPAWGWPDTVGQEPITTRSQKFPTDAARRGKCKFQTDSSGVLDLYTDYVRFGLMTFDTDPGGGTGVNPSTMSMFGPTSGTGFAGALSALKPSQLERVNAVGSALGTWSYFKGWNEVAEPFPGAARGRPAGCTEDNVFEVGARNPAAPPWEGRMIPFDAWEDYVSTSATGSQPKSNLDAFRRKNNAHVKDVLFTTRPFDATPIAGMLQDAKTYLLEDKLGPSQVDPYVKCGKREQYVVLLTDGEPNLDLRPECEGNPAGSDANCPYARAEDTAKALSTLTGTSAPTGVKPIKTFVVGFAMNNITFGGQSRSCGELNDSDFNAMCSSLTARTGPERACCSLRKIAKAGGTCTTDANGKVQGCPYFANDSVSLKAAFQSILANVRRTASRTVPVFSPVLGGIGANTASTYTASFIPAPPNGGTSWSGALQRSRYVCENPPKPSGPPLKDPDDACGDKFEENLNRSLKDANSGRRVIWAYPKGYDNLLTGEENLRPFLSDTISDMVAPSGGVGRDALPRSINQVMELGFSNGPEGSNIEEARLGISTLTECVRNAIGGALTSAECVDLGVSYALAKKTPSLIPPSKRFDPSADKANQNRFQPRLDALGNPSAMGDIIHAVPVAVVPATSAIRDTAYQNYRSRVLNWYRAVRDRYWRESSCPDMTRFLSSTGESRNTLAPNPTMVYATTNDGLLHAFFGDPINPNKSNELWAMVLPWVIPQLPSTYYQRRPLLDGPLVVKDVVFSRTLDETTDTSKTGANDQNPWHTMLLAGFGAGGGGYFAVDVSNPDPSFGGGGSSTSTTWSNGLLTTDKGKISSGPHFRWQLANSVALPRNAANGRRLFGDVSGTPTITTVRLKDKTGDLIRQVGVAVLPGGGPKGFPATDAICNRKRAPSGMNISPADDNRLPKDYPARGKVRQWAAAGCTDASGNPYGVDGRSLYVVRVDTGEILAAFGSVQDLPDFLAPTLVKDPGFDSPITGTPVAFPVDTGEIAREVLVGDADGVLWRLDLSSASPKDWNVEMLVDLYGPTSYAKEKPDSKEPPLAGRPLVTAPILSLKPNGDLGIHVTTGSDDDLFKTGNVNYVVSLTESVTFISSVDKAKLRAEVNWVHQLRTNKDTSEAEVGFEQVSGPMAVFDGTLYFTTYSVPVPTTNTCQNGTAYLYARDAYERHGTATVGDKTGGKCITFGTDCPVCPNSASARFACSRGTSPRPGVSIALAPACTPDPGTGGGSGGTIASTPPQFRLALGGKPSSSSGSGGSGSSKDDQTEPLPKPYSPARVDSWAFIVE